MVMRLDIFKVLLLALINPPNTHLSFLKITYHFFNDKNGLKMALT